MGCWTRRLGSSAGACALLSLASCPVVLPASDQVRYACRIDADCPAGSRCSDGVCATVGVDVDAAVNPADGQVRDAALPDGAALDRGGLADAGGRDAPPDSAGPGDRGAADTPAAPDAGGSDAVAADSVPAPDSATTDSTVADAWLGDAVAADTTPAFDATATDSAVVDTWSGDATPPCPGSPPVPGPVCDADDPRLAACYDFDADQSGVSGGIHDGSGNGNHGTATAVAFGDGVEGLAGQFTTGSLIVVQDSQSMDIADQMTLEAWVRPTAIPTSGRACVIDDEGQFTMCIYTDGRMHCKTGSEDFAGPRLDLDVWTHIACSFEAFSRYRFFKNGQLAEHGAMAGGWPTTNNEYTAIGAQSPSGDSFLGAIDSFRIWNQALDDSELCWRARL
ncbi:MAG: LamG domain-containing protein [Deltaproteobacteria bacterium]|nr:LamG domain-containing protein [Deltaproteobacteria bacterium]